MESSIGSNQKAFAQALYTLDTLIFVTLKIFLWTISLEMPHVG